MSHAEQTPQPPVTAKVPVTRTHHADTFIDDYEWLREKDSPEVLEHLRAENAYAEAVTANQESLREAIFQEIKERTVETDLSVPARKRGWWYFTRTAEGSQYSIHCRVAASDTGDIAADWTPRPSRPAWKSRANRCCSTETSRPKASPSSHWAA